MIQDTRSSEANSETQNLFNIPNSLCAIRFFGSFVMFALAYWSLETPFLILFVVLMATDWADGKLAILLHQRTSFGAVFDTIADVTLYMAVVASAMILRGDIMAREIYWIAAAIVSYLLPVATCLAKFGRIPSFHTRMAKASWLVVTITAIAVFGNAVGWPVRIAAIFVIATNIEVLIMIFVLRKWRTDISSLRAALSDD